jgi:hypothetical protein
MVFTWKYRHHCSSSKASTFACYASMSGYSRTPQSNTSSSAHRQVTPEKPVQVERDGRWHDSQLRAWRRDDDGWRANVLYSIGPGARHLECVDAGRGVGPTKSMNAAAH